MFKQIVLVERRSKYCRELQESNRWTVEIIKWQVFGLTIWKQETLL